MLYIGLTNNLVKRIYEHKEKLVAGFTKTYHITKLVYYEIFEEQILAIEREKQLKAGSRKKKNDLIEKNNPKYEDLYQSIL